MNNASSTRPKGSTAGTRARWANDDTHQERAPRPAGRPLFRPSEDPIVNHRRGVNRRSAALCRRRRKSRWQHLQDVLAQLVTENTALKARHAQLMAHVQALTVPTESRSASPVIAPQVSLREAREVPELVPLPDLHLEQGDWWNEPGAL